MSEPGVRVETVFTDASGGRQIGMNSRATELLRSRREDVEEAVRETSEILQDSVAKITEQTEGWRVRTLEAKFGLTLTAEAGVVLTRASAEASFEVTITIERS